MSKGFFTPDNVVDFWVLWSSVTLCSVEIFHFQKIKANVDSFHENNRYTYRRTRQVHWTRYMYVSYCDILSILEL